MRRLYFRNLFLLFLMFSILLTSFVSADVKQTSKDIVTGIGDALSPVFEALLGDSPGTEFSFAKILILILIVSIIYGALSASGINIFTDNLFVIWIVSIAVGVLGVRFMTPEFVETVALPNTALAVAVTAGIPFVLFFLLTRGFTSLFAKRLAWVFFACIFLGLWYVRRSELGEAVFIYPVTAVIAILMAFFEGIFQKYAFESRRKRAAASQKGQALKDLEDNLETARKGFAKDGSNYTGMIDPTKKGETALNEDIREFEKRIRILMRS